VSSLALMMHRLVAIISHAASAAPSPPAAGSYYSGANSANSEDSPSMEHMSASKRRRMESLISTAPPSIAAATNSGAALLLRHGASNADASALATLATLGSDLVAGNDAPVLSSSNNRARMLSTTLVKAVRSSVQGGPGQGQGQLGHSNVMTSPFGGGASLASLASLAADSIATDGDVRDYMRQQGHGQGKGASSTTGTGTGTGTGAGPDYNASSMELLSAFGRASTPKHASYAPYADQMGIPVSGSATSMTAQPATMTAQAAAAAVSMANMMRLNGVLSSYKLVPTPPTPTPTAASSAAIHTAMSMPMPMSMPAGGSSNREQGGGGINVKKSNTRAT
jgi:hypothetical protein